MTDETKQAYQRGYVAGKKRKHREGSDTRQRNKENAFWQRCFLAALPACIVAQNWTTGKKEPITTLPARTELAESFADEALSLATRNSRL